MGTAGAELVPEDPYASDPLASTSADAPALHLAHETRDGAPTTAPTTEPRPIASVKVADDLIPPPVADDFEIWEEAWLDYRYEGFAGLGGLLLLIGIVRARRAATRRRLAAENRHTQFQMSAIDPRVADIGITAWERGPQIVPTAIEPAMMRARPPTQPQPQPPKMRKVKFAQEGKRRKRVAEGTVHPQPSAPLHAPVAPPEYASNASVPRIAQQHAVVQPALPQPFVPLFSQAPQPFLPMSARQVATAEAPTHRARIAPTVLPSPAPYPLTFPAYPEIGETLPPFEPSGCHRWQPGNILDDGPTMPDPFPDHDYAIQFARGSRPEDRFARAPSPAATLPAYEDPPTRPRSTRNYPTPKPRF